MTGAELFGYTLKEELGRGGFATVYRAEAIADSGQQVAIKLLHPTIVEQLGAKEAFLQEAALLESLDHPNIVSLIQYGEALGTFAIVMEYIDGWVLKDYVTQHGRMPQKQAVQLFVRLLEAIGYAHARGLVHRDLKPANIMLRKQGSPVILDFGIAQAIKQAQQGLASGASRIGSLAYMSPEQIAGHPLDYRTDIYTLGVLLWFMLVGRPPYEMGSNEKAHVEQAILQEPLPALHTVGVQVSDNVQAAIDHATAKDAAQRFQDAGVFRASLQVVGEMLQTDSGRTTTPVAPKYASSIRQLWRKWGLGIILLALLGLALLIHHGMRSGSPPSFQPSHAEQQAQRSYLQQAQRIVRSLHRDVITPADSWPEADSIRLWGVPLSQRDDSLSIAGQPILNAPISPRWRQAAFSHIAPGIVELCLPIEQASPTESGQANPVLLILRFDSDNTLSYLEIK